MSSQLLEHSRIDANIHERSQTSRDIMTTIRVDARRLLCPMPVIRTQDAAQSLSPGDIIEVLCTDPGASHDIPAWCRINGHTVLDVSEVDDELTIKLQIGSDL